MHAHAVLQLSLGAAGDAGPELGTLPDGTPFYRVGDYTLRGVRYAGTAFMDTDVRLAAMDEAGIDVQLLSPNPLTYFGRLDAGEAAAYARAHNDALAAQAAKHPAGSWPPPELPVQDVNASWPKPAGPSATSAWSLPISTPTRQAGAWTTRTWTRCMRP